MGLESNEPTTSAKSDQVLVAGSRSTRTEITLVEAMLAAEPTTTALALATNPPEKRVKATELVRMMTA